MTDPDLLELPLAQQLAIVHAPREARAASAAVFAFDARLARFVAQATEPMVAQLRLAWWRDQLALPVTERAKGDVVLDNLSTHLGYHSGMLGKVVDGWEQLVVAEALTSSVVDTFAANRATLFAALQDDRPIEPHDDELLRAGRLWALADLASVQATPEDRAAIMQIAHAGLSQPIRLSRPLRHLHILGELARSSLRRGGAPLVSRRRDALLISRLGLFGR
ncbi:MAG: hypothetical protein WA954_02680 [Parerythrobacter sp.]